MIKIYRVTDNREGVFAGDYNEKTHKIENSKDEALIKTFAEAPRKTRIMSGGIEKDDKGGLRCFSYFVEVSRDEDPLLYVKAVLEAIRYEFYVAYEEK